MAKKITISELLIKIQADTKEAVKDIRNLDRMVNNVGKKRGKQKQKLERQEKDNVKEAANRIRHEERMQLAAHRAKLKREDVLLRERLRAGERVRREELANHRRALQEQRIREREAARRNRERERDRNRRRNNRGGGVGAGAVAVGNVVATSITSGISGALSALTGAISDLFNMAKNNAMAKEQVGFTIYAGYKDKGLSDEEAKVKTQTDVTNIQNISNEQGASFENVGKSYQAMLSAGSAPTEANEVTNKLFGEIRAMGLGEEATKAIVRELKPLFMGSGISAESVNTLEEWNALPLVANLLGLSVKELAKISKEGKLNAKTQEYTIKQLGNNLDTYGNAKYAPEYFKGDSVTKASQELDAAINRLKDVFSSHASGGIADALNAVADVLAKKETQQAIISAGESFGAVIVVLSDLITGFINTGGLQTLTEIFSPENIRAVADGFKKFIEVMGRLIDWLDWILPDSDKPQQKLKTEMDSSSSSDTKPSSPETSYGYRPEQRLKENGKQEDKSASTGKWVQDKAGVYRYDGELPKNKDGTVDLKAVAKLIAERKAERAKEKMLEEQNVTVDASLDNPFPDNLVEMKKQNSPVEGLQENLKASSELSKVTADKVAPSITNTTNDNRNSVTNNVSVNTTVNGDVGTDKVKDELRVASNRAAGAVFFTH